jgi:hypothetical protein
MPEIGTFGLMSGDGRRALAVDPKLPRPSSTLPYETYAMCQRMFQFGGRADTSHWLGDV